MALEIGINLTLTGIDQDGILKELAALALSNGNTNDKDGLYLDLKAREQEGTTGFGKHIAVPHAKSDNVSKTGVLVGRTTNDIEWNAIDGQPVSTFICLLTPAGGGDEHLSMLSKLSRKLMHEDFVSILKNGSEEEILAQLNAIL